MTDEIIKLYENAGIEKEFEKPAECVKNPYISCDGCMLYDDKKGKCNNRKDYPPFTAEKQIEITKFLLKKAVYYDVKDDKYWFYYEECESAGYKPFDEAIAHFINKLWQDLTEEDKTSIKNILEM